MCSTCVEFFFIFPHSLFDAFTAVVLEYIQSEVTTYKILDYFGIDVIV